MVHYALSLCFRLSLSLPISLTSCPTNNPHNSVNPLIITINIHTSGDLRVDRGHMIKKCSSRKILMLFPAAAITVDPSSFPATVILLSPIYFTFAG